MGKKEAKANILKVEKKEVNAIDLGMDSELELGKEELSRKIALWGLLRNRKWNKSGKSINQK